MNLCTFDHKDVIFSTNLKQHRKFFMILINKISDNLNVRVECY